MSGGRAPYVPMRTDLVKDERVHFIADTTGVEGDTVLGRLFRLWAFCTDRKLADAPDDCEGYAVHPAIVRRFLGPEGVRAILGDGCEALALGDLRADGLIFLHGTETAVASLRRLYRVSHAGGVARAELAQVSGRDRGKFVSAATDTPASEPAATTDLPDPDPDPERERELSRSIGQAGGEPERAVPAPIVPAVSPRTPSRKDNARTSAAPGARAALAAPAAATVFDPEDPAARGRLALATYRRVSDARVAIAAELGLDEQLPFPAIVPSSRAVGGAGSFRDLQERIREEGAAAPAVCERVASNLIAQAREDRSIEWVAEKAFTAGGWRTARAWVSKKPKPKVRAIAAPAEEHHATVEPLTDEDRAEIAELARKVGAGRADAAAAEERARRAPRSATTTETERRKAST
jgi:hypothetical protein